MEEEYFEELALKIKPGLINIKTCLTPENIKKYNLSSTEIGRLISIAGEEAIKYYLSDPKELEKLENGNWDEIKDIIFEIGPKASEILLTPEKLKQFRFKDSSEITKLIKETGKIKDYLVPEKLRELGVNSGFDIASLMIETGKVEDYIEVNTLNEFGVCRSMDIADLIMESENIEHYLKPEIVGKNGFNLESWNIVELIQKTQNVEKYLKPEILGKDKFNLDSWDILDLIKSVENTKDYVTPEILGRNGYNLSSWDIIDLIKTTGNVEKYLKPEIVGENGFNLGSTDIASLIASTGNVEDYLSQDIVGKMGFNLAPGDIEQLIEETGNIEKYLTPEIVGKEGFDFDSEIIGRLIKATKKIEEYLTPEKLGKHGFNLSSSTIISLIKKAGKAEEYLDDTDKLKELCSFNKENIVDLILATGKIEKIENFVSPKDNLQKEIKLPDDMTIGIEIESEGLFSKYCSNSKVSNWKAKMDGSLNRDGIELSSPILRPNEKSVKDIYNICNLLRFIGNSTSERCGGHIHIGADYLKNKQSYVDLLSIYCNTEKLLYIICNDPNDISKRDTFYNQPISKKMEENIEKGVINLEKYEDIDHFVERLQYTQESRNSGLNFFSYCRHETIEFRLPNGTVNPDAWIENINLFGGIVKSAEEISIIQGKNPKERTDEDNKKLMLFEKIQSGEVDDMKKLEALLDLVIHEDREIYINRYKKNIKLLSDKQKKEFENETTNKPIKTKQAKYLWYGNKKDKEDNIAKELE